MQVQENVLIVIPSNFPAKLWRVVNNPDVSAIVWGSQGETIIIDEDLFEKQLPPPRDSTVNGHQAFATLTFQSFIRQLYAYGFRKAHSPSPTQSNIYQFFHPDFKKDKPQLLSRVRRNHPKCRRRPNILPEDKTEKKDACVQCDDVKEEVDEGKCQGLKTFSRSS